MSRKALRHYQLKHIGRGTLLLLLAAGFIGIVYLFSQIGPQPLYHEVDSKYRWEDETLTAMRVTVKKKITAFDAIEQVREVQPGDLNLLEQALAVQTEIIASSAGSYLSDLNTQERLRRRLHTYRGRPLYEQSLQSAQQSRAAFAANDLTKAERLVRQSLAREAEIQKRYPNADYAGKKRLIELRQFLAQIQAKPLHQASLEKEKQAEAAMAEQQWQNAFVLLQQAISHQKTLNAQQPSTHYADSLRLQVLKQKRNTIHAAPAYQIVQKFIDKAKQHEKTGHNEKAAILYQQASEQQRKLNQAYPESRFASVQAIENLEIARQDAAIANEIQMIKQHHKTLLRHLNNREIKAVLPLVSSLKKQIQALRQRFPQSTRIDRNLTYQCDYLEYQRDAVTTIWQLIPNKLVPLPNQHGQQISRNAVDQNLYERIMGQNPSNQPNAKEPINSATWEEAMRFCQRLGWLLGHPVSLPGKTTFQWAQENGIITPASTSATTTVDTLDEWLNDEDPNNPAHALTANPADPGTTHRQPKNKRNPRLTFRFILQKT